METASLLEGDGEMVLSMSLETVLHLWAMIGLFLVVNVTFCLYKVCRSNGAKQRFQEDIEAQLRGRFCGSNSWTDIGFPPAVHVTTPQCDRLLVG